MVALDYIEIVIYIMLTGVAFFISNRTFRSTMGCLAIILLSLSVVFGGVGAFLDKIHISLPFWIEAPALGFILCNMYVLPLVLVLGLMAYLLRNHPLI